MYFTIELMFEKNAPLKDKQTQNITPVRQDLTRLLDLGILLSASLEEEHLSLLLYDQPLLFNASTSQEEE